MQRYSDRPPVPADYHPAGSGCISGFVLPPLAVMVVAGVLAGIAFRAPARDGGPSADNGTTSGLSAIFTPEVQSWATQIQDWAASSDLDPNLVAVLMQIESCGDPFALSRTGAMGLFQVMPYHFLAAEDAYAPDTNARRGLDYLRRALATANNDVRLALAGYNGGLGLISAAEWSWPAETIRYVYWGTGIYADSLSGASESPRLTEWLAAGGAGLCARAGQRLKLSE